MSGGYRNADVIRSDERERIVLAARNLVETLGMSGETYRVHAEWLVMALLMYHDRNEEVHDAWRSVGYLGNLMTLYGKIVRLMNGLFWAVKANGRTEKPLDNAIDAINYSVFFARCYDADDERGGPGTYN